MNLSNDHHREPIFRLPPYRVETTITQLSEIVDWGLVSNHIPQHWKQTQGETIKVAVLDTGIQQSHPDLADAIDDAHDFTKSRTGPADRQGHGTHVAGIIGARRNDTGVVGVAPLCRLLIGKVLGDDGSGSSASVASGIDWAVDRGADLISMSLGSSDPAQEIAQAIDRAVAKNRFVICAAGNEGRPNSVNYPGRWSTTVAVGAVNRNGRVTDFSSRGDEVDICAPGQDVLSTFLNHGYAKLSGTSMATPFVTGVVALMLAKHRKHGGNTKIENQRQLTEHLRRTAIDAGATGKDPNYGYGLINPNSVLQIEDQPPASSGIWVFIPGGQIYSDHRAIS